jgi:hypothetical protein
MSAGPPPEWKRMEDDELGVPVWQHLSEPVRATTWDLELLRYLDVALTTFNDMGPRAFVLPSSPPAPGEGCAWTHFRNSC